MGNGRPHKPTHDLGATGAQHNLPLSYQQLQPMPMQPGYQHAQQMPPIQQQGAYNPGHGLHTPGAQQADAHYVSVKDNETNMHAVLGVILSIIGLSFMPMPWIGVLLGFVPCLAGIALSGMGLVRADKTQSGATLSWIGLGIGGIGFLIAAGKMYSTMFALEQSL